MKEKKMKKIRRVIKKEIKAEKEWRW